MAQCRKGLRLHSAPTVQFLRRLRETKNRICADYRPWRSYIKRPVNDPFKSNYFHWVVFTRLSFLLEYCFPGFENTSSDA